jgi:transposase
MVQETIAETGVRDGVVGRIARQLGIGDQSLRHWVAQAEIDSGKRVGLNTEERVEFKRLQKENKELRRSNEMADSRGGCNTSLMEVSRDGSQQTTEGDVAGARQDLLAGAATSLAARSSAAILDRDRQRVVE